VHSPQAVRSRGAFPGEAAGQLQRGASVGSVALFFAVPLLTFGVDKNYVPSPVISRPVLTDCL
jgi:hypothetical protein